jgi:hypothetical protein
MQNILFIQSSENVKTGPIPQTYSPSMTCPTACSLNGSGCYAASGNTRIHWGRLDRGETGVSWEEFLDKVRKIEPGRLWRHNVAGDLAGDGERIDIQKLEELVKANRGRMGFTYTHHRLDTQEEREAVWKANDHGFRINLSADNPQEADRKASLGIAPVVTLLPSDTPLKGALRTLEGRKVVICPAQTRDDVTCLSCKLCARPRTSIVGFISHGTSKKKADKVYFQR